MTTEQRVYEAQKKIEWLIDGYFRNYVLISIGPSKHITSEWITKHYNTNMSYFRPNY